MAEKLAQVNININNVAKLFDGEILKDLNVSRLVEVKRYNIVLYCLLDKFSGEH